MRALDARSYSVLRKLNAPTAVRAMSRDVIGIGQLSEATRFATKASIRLEGDISGLLLERLCYTVPSSSAPGD